MTSGLKNSDIIAEAGIIERSKVEEVSENLRPWQADAINFISYLHGEGRAWDVFDAWRRGEPWSRDEISTAYDRFKAFTPEPERT